MSVYENGTGCNGHTTTPDFTGWKAEKHTPSFRDREPRHVHSMKWVDADGIEHLHVLRSDDLDDVLREMATIKLCIQHARARAAKARQAETAPSTPRDTQASPQPANQPVPAVVTATDAASCPLHGTSRIKPSKFGGVYCAVKSDGDKWCSWKSGGQA